MITPTATSFKKPGVLLLLALVCCLPVRLFAASHPDAYNSGLFDWNAMWNTLYIPNIQTSTECGGPNGSRQTIMQEYQIPGCPGYRYKLAYGSFSLSYERSKTRSAVDKVSVYIHDAKDNYYLQAEAETFAEPNPPPNAPTIIPCQSCYQDSFLFEPNPIAGEYPPLALYGTDKLALQVDTVDGINNLQPYFDSSSGDWLGGFPYGSLDLGYLGSPSFIVIEVDDVHGNIQFSTVPLQTTTVASLTNPDAYPQATRQWSFVGDPLGCTMTTDANGNCVITAGSASGQITVKVKNTAFNVPGQECYLTMPLNVLSAPGLTFTPPSLPAGSHLKSQASIASDTLTAFTILSDPNNTQTSVDPLSGVVTPGVRPGTVSIGATDQNNYAVKGNFVVTPPFNVTFSKNPLNADGHSSTWASVKPASPSASWAWSIRGPTYGCRIGPKTGQILSGKISGSIIIRATDQNSGDYVEGTLQLKGGCLTPCGSGNCVGGGGGFNNNSVDIAISLGYVDYGQTEASLRFESSTPQPSITSPASLWVAGAESSDVEIIPVSGTDPTIQQVKTPTMLAVVQVVNSSQYNVNLYSNDQITQQTHTPGTPYTLIPGATYFCQWSIVGDNNNNHVVVTETRGTKSYVADYTYRTDLGAVGNGWDMLVDGGTRLERRTRTANPTDNTETYTMMDQATKTVQYQEVRTFHTFDWGEEMTGLTVGTGPNALTTTYTFYTDSSDTADYMHIQQALLPGGSWETYKYDGQGRPTRIVSQFLDNPLPATTADENNNRVTVTTYDDVNNIAEETVTLQGTQISHKYTQTVSSVGGSDDVVTVVQCQNRGVSSMTAAGNLTTVNATYPAGSAYQYLPHLTARPDGTIVLYSYSISSGQETKTVKEGQPNANNTDVLDGMETVTILDHAGNEVSEKEFDIKNASLPLESKVATAQDVFGRPLTYTYGDGSTEKMTYLCCGLESMTDRSGVQTSYDYDNMKRLSLASEGGISTVSQYNVIGKLASVTRITPDGAGSDSVVLNSYQYDDAGRLKQSTDLIGNTTIGISADGSGHRVITTTFPNQSTLIETYYLDGSRLSVGGTSVYPSTFQYGVDADGVYKTEIRPRGGSNAEWVKGSMDMLGRQYKVSYPLNAASQTPYSQYYYSQTTGQLWKQRDPDGVATLYAYNNRGEIYQQAVDLDQDDQISTAVDRVQEFATTFQPNAQNSAMLVVNHDYVWDQPDTGGPVKTETLTTAYALDGSYTNATSFGQSTTWTVAYDPAHQTRTETRTSPDNTQSISVYVNDRLSSVTMLDGSTPQQQISQQTYQYYTSGTHYGFVQSMTDARNGTVSYTYNSADKIASMTAPAPGFGQSNPLVTQYAYDDLNPVGRVETVTLPDQTTVTRTYQLTGELKDISGANVTPAEYQYEQGRVKSIKTWRTYGNESTAEVTTFNYTADRGFLISKSYPNSTGPSYTYYDSGRVKTRTWPGGATTTYTYNNAGDQWKVDYSDTVASPDITYIYNARGQTKTVADANGTCTTTYYVNGLPYTETHTGGPLDGVAVEYDYDAALRRQNTIARKNGVEIYRQVNAFNAGDSRVRDVTFDGICAQYGYEPNSSLISGVTLKRGNESGATILGNSRQHNYLNQLVQTATAGADATVSFNSQFNDINKRRRVTLQDGSYWIYTYDNQGQLTSGKKYWSDGSPVAGQQFEYTFDNIGNRTSTKAGGNSMGQGLREAKYQVNSDNQYASRDLPHYADIMGTADPLATVSVQLSPTSVMETERQGDYFWTQVQVPNTYEPPGQPQIPETSETVTVQGARWNFQQSRDEQSTFSRAIYLPPGPQGFTYTDNRGNMTFDNDWTYTWDEENRLVGLGHVVKANPAANPTATALTFTYDYLGRRIRKLVQTTIGLSVVPDGTWTTVSDTRYVYDGWNLLAELDANGNVLRSYAWGATDSGALDYQGANAPFLVKSYQGMVGTYYLALDTSGNVNSLFNTADGTQAAVYDYGPFGEPLRSTGIAASVCPIGFAGKYHDAESGLVYYGRRYYEPSLGRWLSRDPIDEAGDVNLYGFVGNDPINQQDLLGLIFFDKSSSFWLVYLGRTIDPRAYYENIVSGDSFRVASKYSYDVLNAGYHMVMLPVQVGRAVIHPIRTANEIKAIANFASHVTLGQLKCLLGQKYDEFLHASPEEQEEILAGIVADITVLAVTAGEGEAAEVSELEEMGQAARLGEDATELTEELPPPKFCFPAGTLVLMADGTTKAIEDIQDGDQVLSEDPTDSSSVTEKPVIQVHTNWTQRLIHVSVTDHGESGEFQATGQHPIWTENRGWVNAVDLKVGDRLLNADQSEPIVSQISEEKTTCGTYNLSVEGAHTFFVVAGGISVLVHNTTPVSTRMYIIYTAPDPAGGIYVGRASMPVTMEQYLSGEVTARDVLKYRIGSGHHRGFDIEDVEIQETIFGGGRGSDAYDAIRGAEQLYYERVEEAGYAADQIAPISADNPKLQRYLDSAEEMELGPCP